jgi:hypothetical protein
VFATVRVNGWDQACSIGAALFGWGFRGHADARWRVESTLTRAARKLGCPPEWLNHREYWMLRQFQRRFPAYMGEAPPPVTKLDWLALMQHYGCATRLLDFTYSFYVAAFFALETAEGDAAIWAVNKAALNSVVAERQQRQRAADYEQANIRHIAYTEQFLGLQMPAPCPKLVLPIEPEYLHRRLTAQQGFFLCPLSLETPLQQSLEESFGLPGDALIDGCESTWDQMQCPIGNWSVLKIVIPAKLHGHAVKDLQMMNINSSTLFPGLDGYARSMLIHLRGIPGEL